MTNKLMSHFSDAMSNYIDEGKKVTHEQLGEEIEQKLEDTKFWKNLNLGDGVSREISLLSDSRQAKLTRFRLSSSRLDTVIGATVLSFNREGTTISNLLLKPTTLVSKQESFFALSESVTNPTAVTSVEPS